MQRIQRLPKAKQRFVQAHGDCAGRAHHAVDPRLPLDAELAARYCVATNVVLQAARRDQERFPEDVMIELTAAEWAALRSRIVTLKTGRGQHRKYLPYAFTGQGVAMLSSMLNSDRAFAVNIEIVRAFVAAKPFTQSATEDRDADARRRPQPVQSLSIAL